MTKTFEFKAASGGLRFEVENPYWCRVTLLIEGKEIFLGGDSLDSIKERTLGALTCEDRSRCKVQLEERDIVWAVSLMEMFTTVYVSLDFPKTLYFLYKDTPIEAFDKMILKDDEYRDLVRLMES